MSLSMRNLIVLILLVVGGVATAVSIYSLLQVREAAMESQSNTLLRVVDIAKQEINQDLKTFSKQLSDQIQQDKQIRKAAKAAAKGSTQDINNLLALLDDASGQSLVTTGLLDLASIRVYDKNLNIIATWNENEPLTESAEHQAFFERLKQRDRKDRAKNAQSYWTTNGLPYFSSVSAMGGLRITGYVETVFNPIHNYKNLETRLQTVLQALTLEGAPLYASDGWQQRDLEQSLTISYTVVSEQQVPVFKLAISEDIQAFQTMLGKVQTQGISLLVLTMIAGIIAALFILGKQLFTPINAIANGMTALANGEDTDTELDLTRDDELGKMMQALSVFINTFKENRRVAIENTRIKVSLDHAASNLIILNNQNQVIYQNKAFSSAMQNYQNLGLVKNFNFTGENYLSCAKLALTESDFTKDQTHEKETSWNNHYIRNIIVPVYQDNGEKIGTMVEWIDFTEQVKAEQQEEERQMQELLRQNEEKKVAAYNAKIKTALDNVSTGVLISNTDNHIIYSNKAFLDNIHEQTLRTDLTNANEVSPVPFAKIESMLDYLESDSSTRSKKASLNQQVLEIQTNTITNENQELDGHVYEWRDLTQEVAIEKEIEQLISEASQGNFDNPLNLENKSGFFANLSNGLNTLVMYF